MAERAELEAAAGALLAYHLGGRRTDDALLAQIQAAGWSTKPSGRSSRSACCCRSGVAGKRRGRSSGAQERVGLGRRCRRRWTATLPAGVPGLTGTPGQDAPPDRVDRRWGAARSVEPSPRVQTEVEVAAVEPAHTVWVDVAGIGR
jgi:hypothetical protein